MTRTEHSKALALLRRGRKWFERPNSTVRDWANYTERGPDGKICRKCIYGGIGFTDSTDNGLSDAQILANDVIDRARTMTYYRPVFRKHTRREVLAIYDKAIQLAQYNAGGR